MEVWGDWLREGVGCICGTNKHILGSYDSFVRGGCRAGQVAVNGRMHVLAIDDAGMWGGGGEREGERRLDGMDLSSLLSCQ